MNIGTVKKSRILSFVCFSALLAAVAAAAPASAADVTLKIGGSDAQASGSIGGGDYTWNSTNKELVLTGTINTADYFEFSALTSEDVTITISGDVTINVPDTTPFPAITGTNVKVSIGGANTAKTDILKLTSAAHDGLSLQGGNLAVKNITLKAIGNSPNTAAPSFGYAGIWISGSIEINNADVDASATSGTSNDSDFPAKSGPAFGIMAIDGPITIKGDSEVSAYAEQTGDPKGGRAAGICSVDGNIIIEGDAIVTADAVSKSAAAAGIYSEYGDVEITSDGKVTATGKSQSGGADENQGLGIAAGEGVEITGTTVNAAGTSASGESAGIAAAVPGDDGSNSSSTSGVSIGSGSKVTAQGFGSEGHGIVVEGSGNAEIAAGATVTAVAHGAGYAIDANTIKNNGTATLKADDETHYSNNPIAGNGTITKSLNTPPASGGGGCDAGFGLFAALFALGMFRINRRKRT